MTATGNTCGQNADQDSLKYTPNNECSCQSECQAISGTGCWQLDAARAADAQSYRFVNFGDLGLVCGNTVTNC